MQDHLNLIFESSIAITLTLFSAFLLWGGRRRTRALYFLAALTAALGLMIAINTAGGHAPIGLRNDVNLVLELMVGPLLYLYVVQVQPNAPRPTLSNLVHLTPALLGLGLWKLAAVESMDGFVVGVTGLYVGLAWLSFRKGRQSIRSTPLFGILVAFLILFVVLVALRAVVAFATGAGQSFHQTPYYTALLGVLLAVVWVMVLSALRYPDLLSAPESYIPYGQSGMDAATLSKLEGRLVRLMETQKPHLEPDLTIEDLARLLDTPPRHLSQLINSRMGLTFPSYLNSWRVRAAAEMLRADPSRAIKTAMYESGFRSKSVFNREFLRHNGLTPTQYRDQSASNGTPVE